MRLTAGNPAMTEATEWRARAETCRRAAKMGRRTANSYLLDLADHYDKEAEAIEKAYGGTKPTSASPTEKG
ncbi:MAG: hypothetical protein JWL84_4499 [Rhodospirillales bacterium]|nr:hypothetical protein [Rhodospirillales bacterium]